MHSAVLITVLASALSVSALPNWGPPSYWTPTWSPSSSATPAPSSSSSTTVITNTNNNNGNQCGQDQHQMCCDGAAGALVLQCVVDALDGTCSGSVQCCDATSGSAGLINANLCVPIEL